MAKKKPHAVGVLDTLVKMVVGGGKIDDKLPVGRTNTGSHSQRGNTGGPRWKKPPRKNN